MTIPVSSSISDRVLTVNVEALATSVYFPVPVAGRIKSVAATIGAALTGANETFTLSYAPEGSTTYTAVTGGAVLVPYTSSAAGNTVVNEIGVGTTAGVSKGGSLKIVPSGGAGGGVPVVCTVVIGN